MEDAIKASPRRSHGIPKYFWKYLFFATGVAGLLCPFEYLSNSVTGKSASLQDDRQTDFDKKTTAKFSEAFKKAGSNNLDDPAVIQALGAKGGIRFTLEPIPTAGEVPYGQVAVGVGGMMTKFSQLEEALRDGRGKPETARVYVLTRQGANGGWIGSFVGLQQAQQEFKPEVAKRQQPGPSPER